MRIKLDLSEFLEDERKFSVVNVNVKESKTVHDVLNKISSRFNVSLGLEDADKVGKKKPALGLFEDGFYIHPDETSTVLQDAGILKLKSLPRPGSSGADGRKKKKGKKGASEEEVPHSDGDKKERKNKRAKTEECSQLHDTFKEEKKEKRSRPTEELIPVDDDEADNRKVRKRKRGKTWEEANELEMDVDEVKEQRKRKKSKISEEKFESEDEVQVKERGRWKKEKFLEKTADTQDNVEEIKLKKKWRKEKNTEVEDEDEVEEVPVREKKKRKKEKITEPLSEEEVVKDIKKKKSRLAEQSVISEIKIDKKKTRRSSREDDRETLKAHEAEKRKSKWQEDKNSQEKVVSTSTVINLESEETSDEDDSSDASENFEKQDKFNTKSSDHDDDHYAADSVTDPLIAHDFANFSDPRIKKKRKRKHKKGHRAQKEETSDQGESTVGYVPSQDTSRTPVYSTNTAAMHNIPYSRPRNKRPLLNSNFTQRKHIHFTSDDEKEVSSAIRVDLKEPAHEIEIVETTTRMPRKNEVKTSCAGQSPKHINMDGYKNMSPSLNKSLQSSEDSPLFKSGKETLYHSTSLQKKAPVVVEVEGENSAPFTPADYSSIYNISGRTPLNRNKSGNFDELATLRKICENKTITVCKVDSRKDQAKPKSRETPVCTTASPYLRPPPPLFTRPKQISEESKQTFHNLMTIKSRTMPLIFPNTRTVQRESRTDLIGDEETHNYSSGLNRRALFNNSFPAGSRCAVGQNLSTSAPQNISQNKSDCSISPQSHGLQMCEKKENNCNSRQSQNKDTVDPESLPSTSKWVTVPDDMPMQGIGMISQSKRRDKPRTYQSIGSVLSSMRKQVDSGCDTGELQVISNDEADALPQCGENSKSKSNTERIPKLQKLYHMTSLNTNTKINELPGQVKEKPFMASPSNAENEVVDLESDEEYEEVPVTSCVEPGMTNNSKAVEKHGKTADVVAEIMAENKKTSLGDTKVTDDKYKEKPASLAAKIIADSNKKAAAHVAEIIEDKKKTNFVAEIIEDTIKSNDGAAEIVQDSEKIAVYTTDFVEDVAFDDEIIEDDEEVADIDAEIIEEKEEVDDGGCKTPGDNKEKVDTPSTTAAAVHELEDDWNDVEEAITAGLKDDMLKEVKQKPGKDDGSSGKYSEDYFKKFPIMRVPPKVGEFIAVKVLSLDECYCPVYSSYLQARVLGVNGLKIKLKYVDKIKPKKDDNGKVEEVDLTFEEEVDLTEDALDKDAVTEELDWRDMHEPRLIFP